MVRSLKCYNFWRDVSKNIIPVIIIINEPIQVDNDSNCVKNVTKAQTCGAQTITCLQYEITGLRFNSPVFRRRLQTMDRVLNQFVSLICKKVSFSSLSCNQHPASRSIRYHYHFDQWPQYSAFVSRYLIAKWNNAQWVWRVTNGPRFLSRRWPNE